jgi:hypothetical protein
VTLEQALERARRVGNAEEEAASLINLSVTLGYVGRAEEALRCSVEAAESFARAGLKAGVACAYCNIAEHLQTLERWSEGLEAARTGHAIAAEIGQMYWITGGLNGMAGSSLGLGDNAGAARWAEESYDLSVAANLRERAVSALETGLEALSRMGDAMGEARLRAKAEASGDTAEVGA